MLFMLACHIAFRLALGFNFFPNLPMAAGMWLLSAFALFHALLLLGPRHTLVFFILGCSIGFAAEEVGVTTGWVFGDYEYTDVLGPTLMHVPLVIIISWFMIVYISHVMTNMIITGQTVSRSNYHTRFALAFGTAMLATGYDVAMDPGMSSTPIEAWRWLEDGHYLGVPWTNFAGWMGTAFAISYLYRSFEFYRPSMESLKHNVNLPLTVLIAYGMLGFFWILFGNPIDSRLATFFVMGVPFLIVLTKIITREIKYHTTN